ncbi:putative LRR containing protein [Trachipleistophora hominis]|uniref:Putative LRR containing protein n=1 Tax=Trachipleistophora hominis TaxID=72359 RepID=L7JSS9_TRAHO|nr:putative LRR containing protein [Trachipleistophora hominis]
MLYCNLYLPDNLEVVTLERTEIMKYYMLNVNDACDKITMTLVTGAVHIPYIRRTLNIQFQRIWSFKLLRYRNVIEELVIDGVKLMSSTTIIPTSIRRITLRNITTNDSSVSVVFPTDIKEITLDEFNGYAQFKGFTNELSMFACFNRGRFRSKRAKENDSMLDIYMEGATLFELRNFLPIVSSIYMSRVDIRQIGVLQLSANINELSISNSIGTVNFEFIPHFKGFEFQEMRMFDKMCHKLHFKKARNGQPSHLYVANFQIQETIHFRPEIDEYVFHNVIVIKPNYVAVDKNFKRVKLTNCKGRFKIPGFVSNDKFGTVDVYNGYCGHLEVTRQHEESFDILVRNLIFYKLVIRTNINTAEFDQVKVVKWLHIATSQCKRLILNKFTGPLFVPNITSFKALKLFYLQGLNTLSELPALGKQIRSTQETPVNVESNQVVTLSCTDIAMPIVIGGDNDVNISISKCTFPVNVIGVLIDAVADKSSFCVVSGTEFYLISSYEQEPSELKLVSHHFRGVWRVKKDIGFLSLIKITSTDDSVLQLNEGLHSIRLDSSKIDIDATHAKNLRTITLINTISIAYNPAIHHSLSYLSISDMNIDFGFDLVPSLSTFLLKNCILVPDVVIKVNEGISLLSISRFDGTIDMTRVTGLKNMKFNQGCTLYCDKCTRTPENSLLYIENYTFEHNVAFFDDIETIHLKNVRTAEKTKLTLGRRCKRLKLESLAVNIDLSQAALLEKVTLKDMSDLDVKDFLTRLSTVKILVLENVDIKNDLKLPYQIRIIILRRTILANNAHFIFNPKCNEVRLHHCIGVYDLSKIENLEVFGLHPELVKKSRFMVNLPSLNKLRELDIAYNLNNECLTYHCPMKYVNLQSLTVRTLDHLDKSTPYLQSSFTLYYILNSIDHNTWSYQKIFKYMPAYQPLSDSKTNFLSIKTNIFMNQFFTINLKNKLEYLNLVGCSLSKENVSVLKEFTSLHTLIIDCAFIDNSLFINVPDQLETLEIIDRKVHENLHVNLHNLDFTTVQSLKKHKSIKNIVLDESIMRYRPIFDCLPLKLESLKIKKFPDVVNFCAQSDQKIVVRRLTVLLDGPDTYPLTMIDSNPMISQYYQLFNLLRNYINFNELEELALEASGKLVSLDEKTYQIK